MSTWIFDACRSGWNRLVRRNAARAAALILVPVGVAGCLGIGEGEPIPAVRKVQLLDGAVIVPAPVGYCIEPDSLEDTSNDAFVLIGRCDLLTGQDGSLPVAPAIMTVSVSGRDAQEKNPDGDVIIRSLGAERILTRIDEPDLSLFWVDSAKGVTRSGDSRHWRGIMAINGLTVGLAAYGARESNISGKGGEALIRALARRIRNASPKRPPDSDAIAVSSKSAEESPIPETDEQGAETGGVKKFIGYLFN